MLNQKNRFELIIGNNTVVVDRKLIRTIRLSISGKTAGVHLSVPILMTDQQIEDFLLARTNWIEQNVKKFKEQILLREKHYNTGDSIYFLGKQYRLEVIISDHNAKIEVDDDVIRLNCRSKYTSKMRGILIREWYRRQLYLILPSLINKWERILGVKVNDYKVNLAQTLWGSCNIRTHDVHFSINLAKKSLRCIEYVVAHELTHLLVRGHNKQFYNILDSHFEDAAELKILLKQREDL